MSHHNIVRESTMGSSTNRQSEDVETSNVSAALSGGVPATSTLEFTHSDINDYTSKKKKKKKKRTESSFVVPSESQNLPAVKDNGLGESQARGGLINMRQTSFPGFNSKITNHATGVDPALASSSYPQRHLAQPRQLAHVNSSVPVILYQPQQSRSLPAPDIGFSNSGIDYTPSVIPLGAYKRYSGPISKPYPIFLQTGQATPHDIEHFPPINVRTTPETHGQTAEQQKQQQSAGSQGYQPQRPLQHSQTRYHGLNTQMPLQRQIDTFIANDPWRPQFTHRRHQKDPESFDEITLPSKDHDMYPPYLPYPSVPLGNSATVPEVTVPIQKPTTPTRISPDNDGPSSKSRRPSTPNLIVGSSDHVHPGYADSMNMETPKSIPPESLPLSAPSCPADGPSSAPSLNHGIPQYLQHSSSVLRSPVPSYIFQPSRPRGRTLLGGLIRFMKRITMANGINDHDIEKPEYGVPTFLRPMSRPTSEPSQEFGMQALQFVFATLPRQVYLNIPLLRLPSLYFARVARIFEEADLALSELKEMALETNYQSRVEFNFYPFKSVRAPQYNQLKTTWESFIDSVMREWKTFNIISVLLLSAILSILQIDSAANDPVTRYSALISLICALVSLLFGCIYIIRFGSMRKTYKAAEWALEAKKTKTAIWWNVWVMLAMPAIWLTWSILLYIACIMSYVWRTSPQDSDPPTPLSAEALLTIRIIISSILALGLVYGILILSTFRRYGYAMDRNWKGKIDGWVAEKMLALYSQTVPIFSSEPQFNHPTSHQIHPRPGYPAVGDPLSPSDHDSPAPKLNADGYRDLWPSSDSRHNVESNRNTYPASRPTYPATKYGPPPELHDSPMSRSPNSTWSNQCTRWESDRETSSQKKSTDSFVAPDGSPEWAASAVSASVPSSSAPLPQETSSKKNLKATLAVPPPPHLPPIPGTPMSPLSAASNPSDISSREVGRGSHAQPDEQTNQETLTADYVPFDLSPAILYPERRPTSVVEKGKEIPIHPSIQEMRRTSR